MSVGRDPACARTRTYIILPTYYVCARGERRSAFVHSTVLPCARAENLTRRLSYMYMCVSIRVRPRHVPFARAGGISRNSFPIAGISMQAAACCVFCCGIIERKRKLLLLFGELRNLVRGVYRGIFFFFGSGSDFGEWCGFSGWYIGFM